MAVGAVCEESGLLGLRSRLAGSRERRELAERRVERLRRRSLSLRAAGTARKDRIPTPVPPSRPGPVRGCAAPPIPLTSVQAPTLPDGPPPLSARTFALRRERAAAVPGLSAAKALAPGLPLRSTKYFGSPLQVLNKLTSDTRLGGTSGGRLSEGDKVRRAEQLRGQLERTLRVTTKDVLDSVMSLEDTLGGDAVRTFILPIVAPRLSTLENKAAAEDIHSRLARLSNVLVCAPRSLPVNSDGTGDGRGRYAGRARARRLGGLPRPNREAAPEGDETYGTKGLRSSKIRASLTLRQASTIMIYRTAIREYYSKGFSISLMDQLRNLIQADSLRSLLVA